MTQQQKPQRVARVTLYQPKAGAFFASPAADPNGFVVSELKTTFKIEKTIGGEPNTCELKIYNLAPSSRAFCEQKPLSVIIEAGYDVPSFIFGGDARYAISKIDGPDWITTIYLGDGDRAYRFARVNRSYRAGTSVLQALKDAALSMGLLLEQNVEVSEDLQRQFATGVTLAGPARNELTRLLAPFGYTWSIQDGKMQILRDDEVRADEAIVISQQSGMIGSPDYGTPEKTGKPATLHVKHRLKNFPPGVQVAVESRDIKLGLFRVDKLTMTGDNLGDEWASELDCHPIGSTIKSKKKKR